MGGVRIDAASKILLQSPAAGALSGVTVTLTSNETQALGDAVYVLSTGKAGIAKADAIATSSGIFLAAAAVSGSASNTYLIHGILKFSASQSWTVGQLLYLSATGTTTNTIAISPPTTANSVTQILGVALAADTIFFSPSLVQVEHT